jgi:hypothetical protein
MYVPATGVATSGSQWMDAMGVHNTYFLAVQEPKLHALSIYSSPFSRIGGHVHVLEPAHQSIPDLRVEYPLVCAGIGGALLGEPVSSLYLHSRITDMPHTTAACRHRNHAEVQRAAHVLVCIVKKLLMCWCVL